MTSWHQSQVTTRVLLRMSYPRGPTNGSVCTTWSVGNSNGRSSRASHRRFRWVQVAQAKPFSSNQAVISASGALGEVVIQKQRLLKQNNINLIYILYIHDSIKKLIKLTNKQRVKQTRIDSRSPCHAGTCNRMTWYILQYDTRCISMWYSINIWSNKMPHDCAFLAYLQWDGWHAVQAPSMPPRATVSTISFAKGNTNRTIGQSTICTLILNPCGTSQSPQTHNAIVLYHGLLQVTSIKNSKIICNICNPMHAIKQSSWGIWGKHSATCWETVASTKKLLYSWKLTKSLL